MQDNITEITTESGARVFIAPTGAKDIVTIAGSVLGGPNHLPKEKSMVAYITAELLDAGTRNKSKDELRMLLAGKGTSLSFSSGGDRTYFQGSCLPEDVSFLLSLITECLSESRYDSKEIELAKDRAYSDLIEEKTDTRIQSAIAFSQSMYDETHVNYRNSTDKKSVSLKKIVRADIQKYATFGQSGLVLSVVGDVDVRKSTKAVLSALKQLQLKGRAASPKTSNKKKATSGEVFISIADKTNIDVLIGAPLSITSSSPSYLAHTVLTSMLGGRGIFSGHLTQTIRERDGLTYHISSSLSGMEVDTDGVLQTYATFSPSTFAYAVKRTKQEIELFFTKEITNTRLLNKQNQMAGSYVVGLSTTSGLASALHKIGVDGKSLSYIDEYPKLIREITLTQLKEIAKTIPYKKFSVVASGTLPK